MKKSFFFLILLSFFYSHLSAKENTIHNQFRGCIGEVSKYQLKNQDKIPIKLIEVDVNNYRKWTVNSIRILTSRYRYVEEGFKKRFKGKVTVTYENDSKCIFDARIRHSGDEKDHISLLDNSITQSLDIHLNNGNIRGITKFKLLRPKVRGILEDEIFITEVLRSLNYIAPRTIKVPARVNTIKTTMLFQEKAAKEMLEFNNRREGPFFEGDERFFFKEVDALEDNQLSGWSIGVVPLMNKNAKFMLSKQVNSKIATKSLGNRNLSLGSKEKLNLIYLYFSSRFQDDQNKFNYMEYDLDNSLLALNNKRNIKRLDEYNLFIQAVNGHHGLAINNRKFFWNSIENYFEPINYDSNPNISLSINPGSVRLPISDLFLESFRSLENKLVSLDVNNLEKNLRLSGLEEFDQTKIKSKISQIIKNIKQLEENYLKLDKNLIEHNKFKVVDDIVQNYNNNLKKSGVDAFLISYNKKNEEFNKCQVFLENCEILNISDNNLVNLLEGRLSINKKPYQYLGKNLDFNNFFKANFKNEIKIENTKIYHNIGTDITYEKNNKLIKINQRIPGSKVIFLNGILKDIKIIYSGIKTGEKSNINSKDFTYTYPNDENGLTGCVTFANLNLEKVDIEANGSTCEDTINLINVHGNIDKISIKNSFSDALDFDFSKVNIKNINISNAMNDCVDFSSGVYSLNKLEVQNCGDKALSIGEKSLVTLSDINVKNANIGIASKDSSIAEINNVNIENLKTCLAAYNKKQEYNGGIIEINNLSCSKYYKKADLDDESKIIVNGKSLVNYEYGSIYDPENLKISEVNGEAIIGNLIKDFENLNEDKTINVVVEIPKGSNKKWEVSKISGSLVREFYMGKPRLIDYGAYPVNYGMIPQTVLPARLAGDGDPLDVIIFGEKLTQGKIVKVRPVGVMRMKDSGEQDDKILAVPLSQDYKNIKKLDDLEKFKPQKLSEVIKWFESYKGQNIIEFKRLDKIDEAYKMINQSNRYYKRYGIRPRS